MATFIPVRNSCLPRMTAGERRTSERLAQKLEDDYLVWYDVPIGLRQRRPDFVLLHPHRGLLVLEVKDWRVETIAKADRESFTLLTSEGAVVKPNPLQQARVCALEVTVVLERDPQLRHPQGHRHGGKLALPWGYGVVLTNLTRKQFDAGELDNVLPSHLAICQDEMYESVDPEAFQQRLWAMFPQVYPVALTLPQLDRIRWHLFPEVRVQPGSGQFGLFDGTPDDVRQLPIPDLIRVMDMQQEQLARSLGDGHRVIHGVAGSGKTMILGFRASHLAAATSKPILVLCYNKTLAARLEDQLGRRGLSERVQVCNFHRWCRQMLVSYHVELPLNGCEDFFDQLVTRVIRGVERGQIPRHQYAAILIDEGHDFEPEWYKLIVQMLDPATDSLLVMYDDAQSIYGQRERRKVTWKSLGIQAAHGRTTILRINYRNTIEVLAVARIVAGHLLDEREGSDEEVPCVAPESAGRHGPMPELSRFGDQWREMTALTTALLEQHQKGMPWSEMAVIYRSTFAGKRLAKALADCDIPHALAVGAGKGTLFKTDGCVKLVTMHSSKGLEFPFVIIPDLGSMPAQGQDEAEEARLLYVAMTRATEQLLMLHHSESVFTEKLRAGIQGLGDSFAA
ncbi:MAG TPA: 3'-5' exonuclease [Rhodanobacteraceae bacterium]|nr:3'-5' exonuclease [Rhodanobacteraceae bacterium]